MLSYHIQHSWQKGFLASTHFEISKHKLRSSTTFNLKQSNLGQKNNEIGLFDRLESVARRFMSWPLDGAAHLLFEEITARFPNTTALAVNLQSHEIALASSPFQNVVSQFLGKDIFYSLSDLEFMFKNHHELVEALTNQPSNATTTDESHQRFQQCMELVLVDDDKCKCFLDILFIGSISLSTLRFHRFPLSTCDDDNDSSNDDEYSIEDDVTKIVTSSHNKEAAMSNHMHSECVVYPGARPPQNTSLDTVVGGVAKKYRVDVGKRPLESGSQSRTIDALKRVQSTSSSPTSNNFSSSSISLQRACGAFLLTSDKRQVPQQIGQNLSSSSSSIGKPEMNICDDFNSLLLERDGLELFADTEREEILNRESIVNIVYTGGLLSTMGTGSKQKSSTILSSIANEVAPILVSATTTVDIPSFIRIPQQPSTQPNVSLSFESILQSFLRVIPFHVVEIWVPVQLTNNSTVLLFGASGALDKDLLGWSSYSRNFSFNPDVGLPGRVASARTAESRTDVAKLPMPTFLRAEMAGSLGIHAACGLPFFTGNKCDAVIVFYSRHIFEPTPSLIEYMGNICESLNIRAQIRVLKP